MYGSISTKSTLKFVSAQSYQITGDINGICSGFFRLLFNATQLLKIDLEKIETFNQVHMIWKQCLVQAQENQAVNLQLLLNLVKIAENNYMRSIQMLINSLPSVLQEIFAVEMYCQNCQLSQVLITSTQDNICDHCSKSMKLIQAPTILFQFSQDKINTKPFIYNQNFVLNAVLTAKRENSQTICYTILVDFQNAQNMYILNAIANSNQRQTSTQELTYLKQLKINQYLQNELESTVRHKIGKAQLSCYFNFSKLTGQAKVNAQNEFGIKTAIEPISMPESPKRTQELDIRIPPPSPKITYQRESVLQPAIEIETAEEIIEKEPEVIQRRIKIIDYAWIIWACVGISCIFFIASIIIVASTLNKMKGTQTLKGIIVTNKMYNTISVQSASDISTYVPVKKNQIRLKAASDSGLYIDQLNTTYIHSNKSSVQYMVDYYNKCEEYSPTAADFYGKTLASIYITNLTTTSLTPTSLVISDTLSFGPAIVIDTLTVDSLTANRIDSAKMNCTNVTSTTDGTVALLTITNSGTTSSFSSKLIFGQNLSTINISGTNSAVNTMSGPGFFTTQSLNSTPVSIVNSTYTLNGGRFTSDSVTISNTELTFSGTKITTNTLNCSKATVTEMNSTNFTTTSLTVSNKFTAQNLYATTLTANSLNNTATVQADYVSAGVLNFTNNLQVSTVFSSNSTTSQITTSSPITLGKSTFSGTDIAITGTINADSVLTLDAGTQINTNNITFSTKAYGTQLTIPEVSGLTKITATQANTGNFTTNTLNLNQAISVSGTLAAKEFLVVDTNNARTSIFVEASGTVAGNMGIVYMDGYTVNAGSVDNCK
ncbi:Conserved_hypothetical protein [Hexamita inflata]|uniref:Uncharacterized protein n=1 Tax=Hexamita inflata TaxID=28002 RepID=A0AA86R0A4_9EUKA|nr:Conserved hypothetical protein [Hexamita inflata]